MPLRPYQQAAHDACIHYLRTQPGSPLVVIPTGGGKTHIIKSLVDEAVDRWGGRVIVVAHVKELLEQAAAKLQRPDVGIYSAGLGSKETSKPVTVAGIQSIYRRACEFEPWNLMIVDEAHRIPASGQGQYQQFINAAKAVNPRLRVVGLTATPYRLGTGHLCDDDGLFDGVCYEAGVGELIEQGYLCKLRSKRVGKQLDTSKLHTRQGEYVASEVEALVTKEAVIGAAVTAIKKHTRDRRSVLIFAHSVAHAWQVAAELPGAEVVTGDTDAKTRAEYVERFKAGDIKYLININVLSVGFDAPGVDCVCMLRPTKSAGLYYQQVGRGLRLAEGKDDCLVLDFAGNINEHGPIDTLRPTGQVSDKGEAAPQKVCPECREYCPAAARECAECGHEFPEPKVRAVHSSQSTDAPIISVQKSERHDHEVIDCSYHEHTKRDNPDAPRTLRVDYVTSSGQRFSEWVCIEHDGFAAEKARAWWSRRSYDPFPESANHAMQIGREGGIWQPSRIGVQREGKWDRVTHHWFEGERPAPTFLPALDPDDIPF